MAYRRRQTQANLPGATLSRGSASGQSPITRKAWAAALAQNLQKIAEIHNYWIQISTHFWTRARHQFSPASLILPHFKPTKMRTYIIA